MPVIHRALVTLWLPVTVELAGELLDLCAHHHPDARVVPIDGEPGVVVVVIAERVDDDDDRLIRARHPAGTVGAMTDTPTADPDDDQPTLPDPGDDGGDADA